MSGFAYGTVPLHGRRVNTIGRECGVLPIATGLDTLIAFQDA